MFVDGKRVGILHKSAFFQFLQNPIAMISIDGKSDNKSATFSLKLFLGEIDERKYRMMHSL